MLLDIALLVAMGVGALGVVAGIKLLAMRYFLNMWDS